MKKRNDKLDNNTPLTVGILNQAVDVILQGVDNLVKNLATKDDLKKLDDKVDELQENVGKLQENMQEVKNDIGWIKDDINGIKSDLSDTPSRKEFSDIDVFIVGENPQESHSDFLDVKMQSPRDLKKGINFQKTSYSTHIFVKLRSARIHKKRIFS